MRILHASDLQIGKPYRPRAGEAVLALAREVRPDLVVVAGDLTQRAKPGEFREARAFLDALAPLPVVVTPGNHDVPLYRLWERAFAPYRNWRAFIRPELDSVTSVPGATVVALNSSAPRRAVVGGRLDPGQVALARKAFAGAPAGNARVLVTHHHFIPTPDRRGGRPLPGAAGLLSAFEAMGVDVVLGGHVHQTHLTSSRELVGGGGAGIPLLSSGTAASGRGRGPEAGLNTVNLVHLDPGVVRVVTHRLGEAGFEPWGERIFPRPGRAASGGGVR